MKTMLPVRGIIRRVWLVLVDHSVVGVFRSKKEARDSIRWRNNSINKLPHFVAGPYVLQRGGK